MDTSYKDWHAVLMSLAISIAFPLVSVFYLFTAQCPEPKFCQDTAGLAYAIIPIFGMLLGLLAWPALYLLFSKKPSKLKVVGLYFVILVIVIGGYILKFNIYG
jgi:hypothetical protein